MPPQSPNKRGAGTANDPQPSGKRSRVSRACDQCRTAREKCDGAQPTCFTCSASKRACTYTTPPKKRGIQPGYIRSLELALTWLFQQDSGTEALLNAKLVQEGASSILLGRDTKESNKLHRSWRKSKFCRDIDKLLSGQQIVQDNNKQLSDDEEDSDIEPDSFSLHRAPSIVQAQDSLCSPNHSIQISPSLENNYTRNIPLDIEATPTITPLPPDSWRLLDIYFGYTQCWLPICEKHDVLKLSYSYPDQGFALSPHMGGSEDHAELWSIFALAALQDKANGGSPHIQSSKTQDLYRTARSLIPNELGTFGIGHVKALLNLAVINLTQSTPEIAWLLVGTASRILSTIERSAHVSSTRRKHVYAGCFLLDNLLSIQLQRRPHFQKYDIDQIGKVDEDGLEEWQPWVPCLHPVSQPSRMPALSLSSFNQLVDIVSVLSLAELPANLTPTSHEILGRIELWKASLPSKFDYLRTENVPTPSTPPASLLQLVYSCSVLVQFHSQSTALRILDMLEQSRDQLGVAGLPPVIHCLIEVVGRNSAYIGLDHRARYRLQKIRADIVQAWSPAFRDTVGGLQDPPSAQSRHSFGAAQMPTPESIRIPFEPPGAPMGRQTQESNRPRTSSTLLEDLLPDMTSTTTPSKPTMGLQHFELPPLQHDFGQPLLDHRNSTASRDIENFFDELASLDGAETVENQPQFMQNLGFAPDANMADLLAAEFSQFIPMNSTTFLPQSSDQPHQFDQTSFYDAG